MCETTFFAFDVKNLDAARTLALIRASHPLRYQHVVQTHQLRVGWVFCIKVAVAEEKKEWLDLDLIDQSKQVAYNSPTVNKPKKSDPSMPPGSNF